MNKQTIHIIALLLSIVLACFVIGTAVAKKIEANQQQETPAALKCFSIALYNKTDFEHCKDLL